MRKALADISDKAEMLMDLREGHTVLDIGCNDGTLLSSYRTGGLYKIGFDPAENLAPVSRKVANKICATFFDSETYYRDPDIGELRPRVVTSIAMFYDLENPRDFVSDVKAIMHPDGLWIVQMSYLALMLKQNAFDNVCHEHLEYYSLRSFEYLLNLHEFEIVDVELNDVNGGSFRVYIRNRGANEECFGDETYRYMAGQRVQMLREQEAKLGLDDKRTYAQFAMWLERIKGDVVGFIQEQVGRGRRVFVYGASTKGNTVLQYFGLDASLITGGAERNPEKWGRMTVGTHIPIISEEEARRARPEYFLVLPWHFIEEFKRREMEYLSSGGRFILPAPHFSLV
jgi:SAM-dependent methyltransferase